MALIDPDHTISITRRWARYARSTLQQSHYPLYPTLSSSVPPQHNRTKQISNNPLQPTVIDALLLTLPVDSRWLSFLEIILTYLIFFVTAPHRYYTEFCLQQQETGNDNTTKKSSALLPYHRTGRALAALALSQPYLLTIILALVPHSNFLHYHLLPRLADIFVVFLHILFAFQNAMITIFDSFTA
mmetsp:Transcript_9524/g.11927  ORF Transcript_9524/g.11927 Transcript_9524/m.11927 type:complete len:186 (+) Transcript_9524:448-1005(+)